MPPKKTSEAVYKTMRLNPKNDVDREVLEILNELEDPAKGITFKTVAVDAILRNAGRTPEIVSRDYDLGSRLLAQLEQLFARFAQEIITQLSKGGIRVEADDDDEPESNDKPSRYARTFAKSFIERQRRVMGDEE